MHDVYVEETILGTYRPLDKDEAIKLANDGSHGSIGVENESIVDGSKSTVYIVFFSLTGLVDDKIGQAKANKYLDYIESITGIDQRRF